MGGLLTVGQSRRLFGPIGSAAVVGTAIGSAMAAALVPALPIRSLPMISGGIFAAAAVVAFSIPAPPPKPREAEKRPAKMGPAVHAIREEPFLLRVALLVVLATATALAIDYFFKWTIARSVPAADRGMFVARYYALVNGITLVVQLFLGTALVRKLGVASALEITPLVILLGAGGTFVGGIAMAPVLFVKGIDSSLRSSIHRLTTELVYLPVSPQGRERAKPSIDGALMRVAQAVTAGMLLALARLHDLTPLIFSVIVTVFAGSWLVATLAIRNAYLGQLRRSVARGDEREALSAEPLDVGGAEVLVEHLGSEDPLIAIAAMTTLARRGRHRFISSLILRHPDPKVLERALEILGATARTDWYKLGEQLLGHHDVHVRIAAARALATHGKLDVEKLATDSDPGARGYAAVLAALANGPEDITDDPRVVAAMREGEPVAGRTGMLAAIADAPPSGRVSELLVTLAQGVEMAPNAIGVDLVARATVRHHEVRMIPRLVALLGRRAGRESLRDALVALGEPALEAVAAAFEDASIDRNVRIHLPRTLGRFGTKWAADKLLDVLERERDGRVRYKTLRALGRLVGSGKIKVDRVRIERLARTNLAAHFQLLAQRAALGGPPPQNRAQPYKTYQLFAGLLDDKLRQALERAFRLLKIAHPKEDIHRVYLACLSNDRRARANASEFLDALLRRRDQQALRELVRVVSDDLPREEQARRAADLLGFSAPRTREEAVRAAVADPDIKLATLAALYAVAMGDEWLETALELRPALATAARDLFQEALLLLRGSHA
jgi:AAA family ATP:ADP antiporter